jgi:hypothetical protein
VVIAITRRSAAPILSNGNIKIDEIADEIITNR